MPQVVLLLLRQFIIRSKDREVVGRCFVQEFVQPFAHLFATPTNHCSVINRQGPVGNHQLFVYADNLSEAFTGRTGSDRGVERKHLVGGFFESDAISFESGAERKELGTSVRRIEAEHATAVPFVHGCLGGVCQTTDACLFIVGRHTVDEQVDVGFFRGFSFLLQLHQVVFNAHDFAVHLHAGKALFHVDVQLFHQGSSFLWKDRGKHRKLGSFRERKHAVHDVFCTVLLDQLTADWRISLSHSCEEQTQIFINFGGCADGGTRIPARNLLLDGDGGRNAFDEIAFRLAHASQELAGIRRKAFHIAPLSFRIKRIES